MAILTARVQRFFHMFILSTTSEKSFIPYKASAAVQALNPIRTRQNFLINGPGGSIRHNKFKR